MSTLPLPRAARRGLAQESADLIREAILTGGIAPGSPLREVELAATLGVSRGSVREGMALLEREGLIRSAWHRGTTVIEVTREDVEEVYTLRAALDRLASTAAQSRATSEQLNGLDRLVDAMTEQLAAGGDGPSLLALDIAFHDAIYEAAGNRRLTEAWRAIRSQTHLFQLSRIALGHEHYRARVLPEHRELAALLRSGNRETLAAVAEEHVDCARRNLLTHLGGT